MVIAGQKVLLFALGVLIGRARLLGGLAPFIPAYVMAAGLRYPEGRIPVTAGVITGTLLAGEEISAGWMIAVAMIVHLSVGGWPKPSSLEIQSPVGPALVVGGIASAARCIKVFVDVAGPFGAYIPYGYDFVPALFDGVLAFLLTLVFMDALMYVDSGLASARLAWNAWEGAVDKGVGRVEPRFVKTRGSVTDAQKRRAKEGGVEGGLSTAIMLGCALAGLVGVTIGPVRIQGLVVAVATLLASWSLGAGHGTVCGMMLGVIGVLSTGMSPQSVAALGFAGLLAGLFRRWGKIAAAVGFLVGLVVLSLAFARSWELMSTLSEGSLASLVLALIPEARVRAWTQNATTGTPIGSAANAVAAAVDPSIHGFRPKRPAGRERGFDRTYSSTPVSPVAPGPGRQVRTLSYEVGMACYPDPSLGVVSGDYYVARALGDDKVMLALSDGMGVGERALACSMATVQMIETLIGSGIGCAAAVRAANSIRLFEGADDTFTTLDLAVVDLKECNVTISKAGAPPSFLKRKGKCRTIRMESVPLGVMEDFVPEVESVDIEAGDTLVMMTDGLLERGESATAEMWMAEVIARLEESSSAKTAEDVLRQAFERAKDEVRDDMTVLVMRFSDHP